MGVDMYTLYSDKKEIVGEGKLLITDLDELDFFLSLEAQEVNGISLSSLREKLGGEVDEKTLKEKIWPMEVDAFYSGHRVSVFPDIVVERAKKAALELEEASIHYLRFRVEVPSSTTFFVIEPAAGGFRITDTEAFVRMSKAAQVQVWYIPATGDATFWEVVFLSRMLEREKLRNFKRVHAVVEEYLRDRGIKRLFTLDFDIEYPSEGYLKILHEIGYRRIDQRWMMKKLI